MSHVHPNCDTLGRQISDTVIPMAIGRAGVNGSILRIDTAYNSQGLAYLLTSYADTAGTQIVNQVENIYNPGDAAHMRPLAAEACPGAPGDFGILP